MNTLLNPLSLETLDVSFNKGERRLNADDLVEGFEKDYKIRGMAPQTISGAIYALKGFLKFLGNRDPLKVTKMEIRDWIEYSRESGHKWRTINGRLTTISAFYEYLIFEDLVAVNPVSQVRKRYMSRYKSDGEEHTHKIISVEEAAALVNSAVDIRDKAIMLLLLKTGIRRGELISLDITDISWNDQSIILKETKKRSNRLVFFDDETAFVLGRWLSVRDMRNAKKSPALFVARDGRLKRGGITYIIEKAAERSGVHDPNSDRMEDHFSAHCCRHWFTTHLIRAGMPRDFVKELRGDVRREAIDIYNHIDKKELRESYLAHIPQLGI